MAFELSDFHLDALYMVAVLLYPGIMMSAAALVVGAVVDFFISSFFTFRRG